MQYSCKLWRYEFSIGVKRGQPTHFFALLKQYKSRNLLWGSINWYVELFRHATPPAHIYFGKAKNITSIATKVSSREAQSLLLFEVFPKTRHAHSKQSLRVWICITRVTNWQPKELTAHIEVTTWYKTVPATPCAYLGISKLDLQTQLGSKIQSVSVRISSSAVFPCYGFFFTEQHS